jgi:predicted dienelactone hydrolase
MEGIMNIKTKILALIDLVLVIATLSACAPPTAVPPGPAEIPTQTEGITPKVSATHPKDTPTPTREPQEPTTVPTETPEPVVFPLSEPGPFNAGNRKYTILDESRDGRKIDLLIWYPALMKTDDEGKPIVRDALPDGRNAPYPLIITEEDSGRYIYLSHLASHGFILMVVQSPPSGQTEQLETYLFIDQVRDFLLALDLMSSEPPEELQGLIDFDQVGVTGYSYGGDISLAISGARIDPEFYLSQCEQLASIVPSLLQWVYIKWTCLDAGKWDDFVAYAGAEITTSEDGLWQPITDERIRAVMPMAPNLYWYYGERGLAAVDRPTLLIWGTKDNLSPYQLEAAHTYESLGTPERFLISFIGRTHMMPFMDEAAARIKHFATAFFGYYLQGREDYGEYFSEDFVSRCSDLSWGVYAGE